MNLSSLITRARLVTGSFVVAVASLTTTLAFAQDHAPTGEPPAEHAPATAEPAAEPEGHAPAPAAEGHAPAAASAEHGSDHGSEPAPAASAHGGEHHGEAAAHDPHAAGGHHGPEALNWTDIWDKRRPAIVALVINFGVLLALYYMLGKKPVVAALKQRRVTIGKEIDEAQQLLKEAKERAKKYQGDLKNVDADATTAKASLIAAAKGEVDQLLEDANERAERMKRDAVRLVEQERKQLQHELLLETVELSVTEASKILEKSVTAEDHLRLAQDLLAELGRRPSAKAPSSAGGAS